MTALNIAIAVNLGGLALNLASMAIRARTPRVIKRPCDIIISPDLTSHFYTGGPSTPSVLKLTKHAPPATDPPAAPPQPLPVTTATEYIIAHRAWLYHDLAGPPHQLRSLTNGTIWPSGNGLAARDGDMDAGLGIYAFKTERDVFEEFKPALDDCEIPIVYGTVALWGRVIECERGYRAQFAYPLRVICRDSETANAIARQYGVETEGAA